MAYGLRYLCEFLNVQNDTCRLEIHRKDYYGDVQPVSGGENPFVISKEIEDILAPVQASKATINITANYRQDFDLDSFYSEDDEEWLVKFYIIPFGGIQRQVFYAGSDTSTSFTHTSTDNRISFGNQTSDNGIKPGQQLQVEGKTYDIISVYYFSAQQNLDFIVSQTVTTHFVSTPLNFVVYDMIDDGLQFCGFLVQDDSGEPYIDFDHSITLTATDNLGLLSDVTFDQVYTGAQPIFSKFTILEYLSYILPATGLSLPLQAFTNLFENSTPDRSTDNTATFLEQTCVFSGCFAKDDGSWLPCFEILSTLMEEFGCVLCQKQGKWMIYRPGEFRLAAGSVPGTEFSPDYQTKTVISLSLSTISLSSQDVNSMIGAENNQSKNVRPYKFTKESFAYEQPAKLIQNLDLQTLGNQIRETTETRNPGTPQQEIITLTDYEASYWFNSPTAAYPTHNSFYIRVERDSKQIEINRYLVAETTDTFQVDAAVVSSGMYANKGDKINVSVSAMVPGDNGKSYYRYFIRLYNGTTRYYLSQGNNAYQNGSWQPTFQPVNSDYNPAGSNYREWHSWGVESLQIPVDGWINIQIGIQNDDGGKTYWKDFSLAYEPFINESTQITGQVHTETQSGTIKNNDSRDRHLDDSPRNLIAGTLLTSQITNFNQGNANDYFPNPASDRVTKTANWHRFNGTESLRLGQITTLDLKQIYSQLRQAIDCTIVFDADIHFATLYRLAANPTAVYLFGRISAINYRMCQMEGTLIEVYKDGEAEVQADYDFEYTYEKQK